jgi:hypothetical protein
MLATDHYPYHDVAMPNHELLEVHRGKISLHRAKLDTTTLRYAFPSRFQGL